VILMLVSVVLAACAKKAPRSQSGSGTPTTASATSPAALPASTPTSAQPTSNVTCAIVTVAEVNAALGTVLGGRHIDTSNPPTTVCTFSGGTASKSVIIRFQAGQDTSSFAGDKATLNGTGQKTTDVSGYGDEAYMYVLNAPGGITVTTLVARKGDVVALISASTAPGPIETLMQKILSQVQVQG
jgi:hypothetical protein